MTKINTPRVSAAILAASAAAFSFAAPVAAQDLAGKTVEFVIPF